MKAIAWAILLGLFLVSQAIDLASGRERPIASDRFWAVFFLVCCIGFLIACLV